MKFFYSASINLISNSLELLIILSFFKILYFKKAKRKFSIINSMQIIVAKNSGFCPGVNSAIKKAIEVAQTTGKKVYTLGQLIHNNDVIKELEKKGIKAIENISEIEDVKNSVLIIRAHGISPQLEEEIKKKGIEYLDATCPLVKKVHKTIQQYKEKGYTTIIFGDEKHAEVIGLKGYAGEKCIVIQSVSDAEKLGHIDKANLVSQTTQEEEIFLKVAEIIRKKIDELIISNTICEPTKKRQEEVKQNAPNSDLVIVVGARHSSNTNRLFEICKDLAKKAVLIENETEINSQMLEKVKKVFIVAGASTPSWIIERVVNRLKEFSTPHKMIRDILNFSVSTGIISIFSFFGIFNLASGIGKINLNLYESLPYVFSLSFAHLINRQAMINEESLKKTVLTKFASIVKVLTYTMPTIVFVTALSKPILLFYLIPFILLSIFYGVYHTKYPKIALNKELINMLFKRKGIIKGLFKIFLIFLSKRKELITSLGWIYIIVIVPFVVYNNTLDKFFFLMLLYTLLISFIRNQLIETTYIQSDLISSSKFTSKSHSIYLYSLYTGIILLAFLSLFLSLLPFFTLGVRIFLILLFFYYFVIIKLISNKTGIDTIKAEFFIDLPFIILPLFHIH